MNPQEKSFIEAVKTNNTQIVFKMLAEKPNLIQTLDADPNFKNFTAIHHALYLGYTTLFELLIKYSKSFDSIDYWDRNILHWAIRTGNEKAVEIICEQVDLKKLIKLLNQKDHELNTPVTISKKASNDKAAKKVLNIFLKKMIESKLVDGPVDFTDKTYNYKLLTSLYYFIENKNEEKAKIIKAYFNSLQEFITISKEIFLDLKELLFKIKSKLDNSNEIMKILIEIEDKKIQPIAENNSSEQSISEPALIDEFQKLQLGQNRLVVKSQPPIKKSNKAWLHFTGEEGKKPGADLRLYKNLYDTQTLGYLLYSQPSSKILSFVTTQSESDNIIVCNEILELAKLRTLLQKPVGFITIEPSSINTAHFIAGFISADNQLLLVNPLGLTQHQDFYHAINQLNKEINLKAIYLSTNIIQQDKETIVSCGPLCIELLRDWQTNPPELANLTHLPKQSTEKEDLSYIAIELTLPGSLIALMQEDSENALTQLRQKHAKLLEGNTIEEVKSDEDFWHQQCDNAPIQVLVRRLLNNEINLLDIKNTPEYQLLTSKDPLILQSVEPVSARLPQVSDREYEKTMSSQDDDIVSGAETNVTHNISLIDELARTGLDYHRITGDGHCLYNSVGLYIGKDVAFLRNIVATHLEHHKQEFNNFITLPARKSLDDFIDAVRNSQEWAGNIEIEVLMRVLDRPILIMRPNGQLINLMDKERFTGEPIFVYYNGINHYDGLILKSELTTQIVLENLLKLQQNMLIAGHQLNEKSVEKNGAVPKDEIKAAIQIDKLSTDLKKLDINKTQYLFLEDLSEPDAQYTISNTPVDSSGDIYHILAYLILSKYHNCKMPIVTLAYDRPGTEMAALRSYNLAKLFKFENIKAPFSTNRVKGCYQNGRAKDVRDYFVELAESESIPQYLIEQKATTALIVLHAEKYGLAKTNNILRLGFKSAKNNIKDDAENYKKLKTWINCELDKIKKFAAKEPLIIINHRYAAENSKRPFTVSSANFEQNLKDDELKLIKQELNSRNIKYWFLMADSRQSNFFLPEPRQRNFDYKRNATYLFSSDIILKSGTYKGQISPAKRKVDDEPYEGFFKFRHILLLIKLQKFSNIIGIIGGTSGTFDIAAFLGWPAHNFHQFKLDNQNNLDYQEYRILLQHKLMNIGNKITTEDGLNEFRAWLDDSQRKAIPNLPSSKINYTDNQTAFSGCIKFSNGNEQVIPFSWFEELHLGLKSKYNKPILNGAKNNKLITNSKASWFLQKE